MVKILAQAGTSLADVYDVEGSIAGIEQLDTRELPIVHEMGATVFSERLSLAFRRSNTAALLQTVAFDIVMDSLPEGITRILGISVYTNNAPGRILNATVSLTASGRELPIWNWDAAIDIETIARVNDDGGGVANLNLLRPVQSLTNFPTMLTSVGQPQQINEVAFRGTTATFGAGTVIASLVVMLAHTHIVGQGISSRGLPIPGW